MRIRRRAWVLTIVTMCGIAAAIEAGCDGGSEGTLPFDDADARADASGDAASVDGSSDAGIVAPSDGFVLVLTPAKPTAFAGENVAVSVGYVAGSGYKGTPSLQTPTAPPGMTVEGYIGSASTQTAGTFFLGIAPTVAPGKYTITVTARDAQNKQATADLALDVTPSKLDPSFGNAGLVTTTIGTRTEAAAAVLQADGKIVVCGGATTNAKDVLVVARYTTSGTLDGAFGSGGLATLDLTTTDAGSPAARCADVALQSDGKIVVVGTASAAGGGAPRRILVSRFDANGTLDPTFDSRGFTQLTGGTGAGVVVESAGTILVVGNGSGGVTSASVTRLATNGTSLDGWSSQASTNDVALQSTGAIILSGYHVRRFNPDGGLDPTFSGAAETDNARFGLAIQSDDKVVTGGSTGGTMVVRRLLANGGPDPAFGTGGATTLPPPAASAPVRGLAIDTTGRIVAGGENAFVLARYLANGSVDTTFGHGGSFTTDFGLLNERIDDVLLGTDSKIIAVGTGGISPVSNQGKFFAVARYLPQ